VAVRTLYIAWGLITLPEHVAEQVPGQYVSFPVLKWSQLGLADHTLGIFQTIPLVYS
jgi:hypothetical protein